MFKSIKEPVIDGLVDDIFSIKDEIIPFSTIFGKANNPILGELTGEIGGLVDSVDFDALLGEVVSKVDVPDIGASIKSVESVVKTIDGTFTSLSGDLNKVTGSISTASAGISTVVADVGKIKGDIDTITGRITNLFPISSDEMCPPYHNLNALGECEAVVIQAMRIRGHSVSVWRV